MATISTSLGQLTAEQIETAEWLAALLNELGIPTGDGPTDAIVMVTRRGYISGIGYDDEHDSIIRVNAKMIDERSAEAGHHFHVVTADGGLTYVTDRAVRGA